MPKGTVQQLATRKAQLEILRKEIQELKRQQSKEEKAEKQQRSYRIGRLAVDAGLDHFEEKIIKTEFANLYRRLSQSGAPALHPRRPAETPESI